MNKQELVADLSLHNDITDGTKAAASRVLDFILAGIQNEVASGNEVTIAGFGKFYPYKLSSGKVVPKFKAFEGFKARVMP